MGGIDGRCIRRNRDAPGKESGGTVLKVISVRLQGVVLIENGIIRCYRRNRHHIDESCLKQRFTATPCDGSNLA